MFKNVFKKKVTSLEMAQILLSFYDKIFHVYLEPFSMIFGINQKPEIKKTLAKWEFNCFIFVVVYICANSEIDRLKTGKHEELFNLYLNDLHEKARIKTYKDKSLDESKRLAFFRKNEMLLRFKSYVESLNREGVRGICVLFSNIIAWIIDYSGEDDIDAIYANLKNYLKVENLGVQKIFNWMPVAGRIEFPLSIIDATSKDISTYLKNVNII